MGMNSQGRGQRDRLGAIGHDKASMLGDSFTPNAHSSMSRSNEGIVMRRVVPDVFSWMFLLQLGCKRCHGAVDLTAPPQVKTKGSVFCSFFHRRNTLASLVKRFLKIHSAVL